MSKHSSRRRPKVGASVFSAVLVILILVIVAQLFLLSQQNREREEPVGSVSEGTGSTDLNDPDDPDDTGPYEDPNRIIMNFDTVVPPEGDEYLDAWPGESSVETLRDASDFMEQLKGRAFEPGALEGVTVILDPGHGGVDGGTAYPLNPPHEIIEKDIVLPMSIRIQGQLEELGANVVMTRTTDEFVSIYSRMATAGEVVINQLIEELEGTEKTLDPLYEYEALFDEIHNLNIDFGGGGFMGGAGTGEKARLLYDIGRQFPEIIFVSVHINSFYEDPNIGGLQVFYVDNPFQYQFTKTQAARGDTPPPVYQNFDDENRLRMATTFMNGILSTVPELETVGGTTTLKQEGFVVLNRTGLESVMLELGFVTNANDRQNLLDPAFQNRLADSITRSIFNYFCNP